jgi:hypothetical protein
MSNDVTISLSFGSSAGIRSSVDAGADAPSPLPPDELGAPGGTSGIGTDQSSSQAPEPLPLDELRPKSSQQDAVTSAPSPLPPD